MPSNVSASLFFVRKVVIIIMRRDFMGCVVPNHREIKISALGGVLKQAGVSAEEFLEALRK